MTYQVVYADPPWPYTFPGTRSQRTLDDYETMSPEQIMALSIPADPSGSVLFMWAINPELPLALDVMSAWGSRYRTNASWDKEVMATGAWFRGQHELLLVGTMGHFSPPQAGQRVSSVIRCRRASHSQKPSRVRELIASWFPGARKLELFAREAVPGWDAFGNQVSGTLFKQTPSLVEI